uniref:PHD-type domain-containing protein n=1 Tax=Aegilops tauschii subsp. strangulata TaxID=200361 RepID=A0A453TEK7_AEGTS
QEPVDEPTDHLQPYPGGLAGGVASPASPRRFTRSLLQQVKQPPTDDGDNDESGTTTASSSPSPSPKSTKRGASLKAKSEGPDGIPKNLRELFATGLLEGQPVNYFMNKGKRPVLRGVIKDTGILCSCTSCKGRNVVSPFYFEVHAGSHKKRPSDYIFLESGNTLHDVLRACTDATVDTLESAILGAIGPVPKKRTVICQDCKSSFKTFRAGKFASFCDTCLESKEAQSTARPRGRPPKNLSPGTKTTSAASPTSSYGAKTTRAGSPTSYGRVPRNFYPVAKTISAASPTSSGRVPKNFSPGSKPTSAGRITRKDHGLHKLVFMSGVLAEGTDVGYYVQGKRLLDGHIKEHGIYCYCCNTVVSPSQFEGHAGRAARRKPYHNIYISNGVSLHELSVSLSKGRKPSEKQNDDLCSICSDGGELLLCDSCPRAFHRECVGLSCVPKGAWCCRYCENRQQRESYLAYNNNAIAAGRVDGVDSIGQIFTRSIRIATAPQGAFGGCALCKQHDFGKKKFSERTVLLCDQCGREYHVGCLKEHNMADLTVISLARYILKFLYNKNEEVY